MEMKPEYNHGQYNTYHVKLYSGQVGNNTEAVLQALSRHSRRFIKMQIEQFLPFLEFPYIKLFDKTMSSANEEYYYRLTGDFEQAGASPEIKVSTNYMPIEDKLLDSVLTVIPKTYTRTKKKTIVEFFTSVHEYALDLWAQANAISEAYRLFINNPHSEQRLFRIWWHDNGVYIKQSENEFSPTIQSLNIAEVASFKQWMEYHFWTSDVWHIPISDSEFSNRTTLDGSEFLIEGWKEGSYKVLFNPTQTASAKGYAVHKLLHQIMD